MSAHNGRGPIRAMWIAALAAIVGGTAASAGAQPGETERIAFSRAGDVWSADPDGTDEVRLTSGPADDRWPRWSPEGARIAVVRDGDLVLLRATGAPLRVLTTHGDVVAAPSWSPDGLFIAYVRGSGGIAIVAATQEGSNGTPLGLGAVTSVAWNPLEGDRIAYTGGGAVFTVRPDGSEAGTEMVPPDPDGRTRDALAWDPGTGQVVFTSTGADGTRIEGAGVSLDGASGDDRSPAWSPGGQQMLFTRGGTLHVFQRVAFPDGGTVRSLGPDGETPHGQPSLVSSAAAYETSAGTQLFFRVGSLGAAPSTVTYTTVAGAGSATEGSDYVAATGAVTTPDAFGNAAAVPVFVQGDAELEPDETFYVDFTFPSDPEAPLRVRGTILNDDGGRNGVITHTGGQMVSALDPVGGLSQPIVAGGSAVPAPGGQRLAYLQQEAGQVQLVVGDASGLPQATFPLAGPMDHEIVWSPDGARLAWTVGATLWVADPSDPAGARSIATEAVTPSWSSDTGPGRRLAFAHIGTGTVCTVREDGTGTSCPAVGTQPQWSPDNATIAFRRGDGGIFLMDPDGTNERLAASAPGPLAGGVSLRWSPGGGSFAFMTGTALFVAQEGTPPASVAGLPASLWAFDWSPDGRQLVAQGIAATGQFELWVAGPDEAGSPFAAVRQITTGAGGAVEPRWSSMPVRPSANLVSRGGIERFQQARAQVELDAPSPDTVTLTWETVDTGSATPGADFVPGGGTVTLPPGQTTGVIAVALLDDGQAEGSESFDVRLTGATGARPGAASQVAVFITDDDNAPVAVPDMAATAIDTPVEIAVLANDSDPDGEPLNLAGVDAPAHGTAAFTGGVVTYTPGPGYEGVDHFLYTVSDGTGHTARGLVSVYVGVPLPAPPVLTVTPAFLDFGTVPLNKTKDLVITVTNTTAEPVALAEVIVLDQAPPMPFDVSDFEGCRAPSARELDPGESCTQKVRFWSIPGADAASPATARLLDGVTFETLATVAFFASTGPPDTGPNLPPVAVDDLAGVAPGFTHTLDAVRNDSDPDHDILRITALSDPPHGTVAVIPCNSFPQNPNADCMRYVPDAGYLGTDAFTYTVSDGRGGDATATFHLAVGNVVPQVSAVTPSSGPPAGGQAIRITGSGFLYRSEASFLCPSGQLPLAISQLTDTEILASTPPAPGGVCAVRVRTLFGQQGQLANAYRYNTAPLAQDGAVSTNEDTPVTITLTATDADGDPLTFAIVTGPGHGALSAVTGAQVTYTPASGYSGPDTFTFRASDGQADSNVATVSITVSPQGPLVATTTTVATSGSPSRAGQTVTFTATVASAGGPGPTPEGSVRFDDTTEAVTLGTAALDASGTAMVQTSVLAIGAHTIQATYLPAPGQIYGGSSGVVIQVVEADLPPVAVDDGPFSVLEGDVLTVPPPGVLANDADPEQAALTARFVTAPAHGVLFLRPSGGFDYTPGVGYVGTDSFTYVANDGQGDSNVATVSLVVHPRAVLIEVAETVLVTDTVAVDPAVMIEAVETIQVTDGVTLRTSPRADDGTASTAEDTPALVTLPAADADGDPFTLTIVSGPVHGTVFPPPGVVMPSGTLVTYTPAGNYFGADSFTFKATDAQGDSNLATIVIAVAPAPDAPAAAPDGPYVITQGETLTQPPPGVLANDADGDLEPLTARLVTPPAHGTLTLTADGAFTYVPVAQFFGQDAFTYVASDGLLESPPATVAIVVQRGPGHEVVTGMVPAGGTLATDTEGDGSTPEDDLETAVLTPQGGEVVIDEGPAPPPLPTAFTFLPREVQVSAPQGTPNQPLQITFLVDGSLLSAAGGTVATLAVFRNGLEVPPCRPGPAATPDPCVWLRQMAGDDARLVVRTSRASVWTFGVPRSTSGLAAGSLDSQSGAHVVFTATRFQGHLVGALSYRKGNEWFLALCLSALAVEDDGNRAWFAGLGADGRTFLAYAEDGGAGGDVFRLWIGGVEKTGDGSLASGHVVVMR